MRVYPLIMYSAGGEDIIVRSGEQEHALPLGWADSPAAALEMVRQAEALEKDPVETPVQTLAAKRRKRGGV